MTKDYFEYLFICDICYWPVAIKISIKVREMYVTAITNATNCFLNSQPKFFIIVKTSIVTCLFLKFLVVHSHLKALSGRVAVCWSSESEVLLWV